ncbi:Uncharacterized protein HZ326_9695 [Fusarium oxysporum f. sp. albedinis]|nr:Uncharacterized protein HZ326_9695 [Fusarium oxysporum f. sp. albedinis]
MQHVHDSLSAADTTYWTRCLLVDGAWDPGASTTANERQELGRDIQARLSKRTVRHSLTQFGRGYIKRPLADKARAKATETT